MRRIAVLLVVAGLAMGCAGLRPPEQYVKADLLFYAAWCPDREHWLKAEDVADPEVREETQKSRLLAFEAWLLHLKTGSEAHDLSVPECPGVEGP